MDLIQQSNEFTLDDVHKLSIRVHVVTVLPTWRSCTAPRRRPGPWREWSVYCSVKTWPWVSTSRTCRPIGRARSGRQSSSADIRLSRFLCWRSLSCHTEGRCAGPAWTHGTYTQTRFRRSPVHTEGCSWSFHSGGRPSSPLGSRWGWFYIVPVWAPFPTWRHPVLPLCYTHTSASTYRPGGPVRG